MNDAVESFKALMNISQLRNAVDVHSKRDDTSFFWSCLHVCTSDIDLSG